MNMFEEIVISMILIMFPLFCYLFYIVANNNIDEKHRDLALCFSLISSFYLIEKFDIDIFYKILLLSIPVFFAYKRKYYPVMSILLVTTIILHYDSIFSYLLFADFILVLFFKYDNIFFKTLLISTLTSLLFVVLSNQKPFMICIAYLISYIAVANLVSFTIRKGEEVITYHIEFNNMKKEYEIRHSLFKITHEIKNPLAVCKAYIDMFNYDDPKCAKKYIPIISGEIDKLLILLQDFLLVNKDNINFDIMDINVLLEEITASMCELNKFDIHLETLDDEVFINGDYNRLTQVMTNLIKNSFEAHANKVIIKLSVVNDEAIIEVIDNGDGIDETDKNKIYLPFFTTKKDGTGLGVSLSKEIIEAHNGILEYQSNNKGTIAKISLPVHSM